MPVLAIDGLRVWYGPTEVLRGVTLTVPESEVVALLGGNGSGKSTTLNAVSGFLRPTAGTITFAGRRIDRLATDAIVKAGIVQIPQGREVFSGLTIEENLELGAVTRRDAAGVRADLERLYSRFSRLAERRRQRAGTLSGGEQQMLAIARALMARPRMLLMDEPSAGLAPVMVQEIARVIDELHRDGLTILLVEQNVGVALSLASVAHIIRDGVIAVTGAARDLVDNPDVVKSYLGG
jgi:branched-chain amino acid transport system ATP-binding protein